jgi:hypothetical protein
MAFHDAEGKEADVSLGALDTGVVQGPQEGEPVPFLERSVRNALQVDVVAVAPRLVHLAELPLPPPVGLGIEVDQLVGGLEEEVRHLSRKRFGGRPRCHLVPLRSPWGALRRFRAGHGHREEDEGGEGGVHGSLLGGECARIAKDSAQADSAQGGSGS